MSKFEQDPQDYQLAIYLCWTQENRYESREVEINPNIFVTLGVLVKDISPTGKAIRMAIIYHIISGVEE